MWRDADDSLDGEISLRREVDDDRLAGIATVVETQRGTLRTCSVRTAIYEVAGVSSS